MNGEGAENGDRIPRPIAKHYRKDAGYGPLKAWPILLAIAIAGPLAVKAVTALASAGVAIYDTIQAHGQNTIRIEVLEVKDETRAKQIAELTIEVRRLADAVERANKINEPIHRWLLKNSIGPTARGGSSR